MQSKHLLRRACAVVALAAAGFAHHSSLPLPTPFGGETLDGVIFNPKGVSGPTLSLAVPSPAATEPLSAAPWTLLPTSPMLNHGPGTSGGGSSVMSGETLRDGSFEFELRTELTEFDEASVEEAEAIAIESGEFDSLGRSLLSTVSLSYGLTDDWELGAQVGYYRGSDFIDAEEDGLGGAESATADPEGMTDLWLRTRYRAVRTRSSHLALLGGVKLPTGKDDEELSNGEVLEPSSQPGTGAVDYQLGLAYTRHLSSRTTLDASGLYTLRTEHDDFEVGDRADLGAALAYRLTEDAHASNRWSILGELLGVWIGKDEEDGDANDNSGGATLYLSGGVQARIGEHFAVSLAPAVALLQDVNGEQVETDWKVALTLSATL